MSLYLVQHGLSLPREVDPDRGLSEKGLAEVERMAVKAREIRIKVSRIIHSGKARAAQTADAFAALLTPGRHPEGVSGLDPMDDAAAFARGITGMDELMIVGHLPFLARLAAHLVTGSTKPPVIRFANGGIVCLEHDKDLQTWVIGWALIPEII